MNFELDEIMDIKKAVIEFTGDFAKNFTKTIVESEFIDLKYLEKMWKKGYELGYFKLDGLSTVEAVSVFEGVHSVSPEIGVPMLYFTVSDTLFGELASLAFQNGKDDDEREDRVVVSDFVYDAYVLIRDAKSSGKSSDLLGEAELIKCTSSWHTQELVKLNMSSYELLEKQKLGIDFISKLKTLLAARCIGTAEAACKDAVRFLKEMRKLGKLNFDFYKCQKKLGEIAAELEASRLLTYKSAWKIDRGELNSTLAEMSLWKAARTAVMAADEAAIIQEGVRYIEDYRVEIFRKYTLIEVRGKILSISDVRLSDFVSPYAARFWDYLI